MNKKIVARIILVLWSLAVLGLLVANGIYDGNWRPLVFLGSVALGISFIWALCNFQD